MAAKELYEAVKHWWPPVILVAGLAAITFGRALDDSALTISGFVAALVAAVVQKGRNERDAAD